MAGSENEHYKIIRCPSDISESPEVSRRGHSYRLGAADEAFESSFGADDDVADRLGCTTEAARRKLDDLHAAGTVGRRKTAGRVVYWLREESAPNDVAPDDAFWETEPIAGDDELSVTALDDVLYGPATDE